MQQILINEIDVSLLSYPPVMDRLFRARVRIQTPSHPMPATWTAAQLDSFTESLSVASREGETFLTVSSLATPLATDGRLYYVFTASGERFSVKLTDIQSVGIGSYRLHLADPLPMALPIGTNIGGYAVFYDFDATEVTNQGECIARWQVDIRVGADIVQHVWDEPFLIVNAETNYTLNSASLVRTYPMVDRLRPPTDEDLTEIIKTGWTNYLRSDLEGKGIKANQIKSWERLEAAHAAACVYHLVLTDERQDAEYRETWRTNYAHQCDLMFASIRFWYSPTDGSTPAKSDEDYSGRSISR
jgi:hypothetical protein